MDKAQILDREIYFMKHELKMIEKNPERNLQVKNHSYTPLCFTDKPSVSLDDEDGLYAHYESELDFLEEVKRGHVDIVRFPFGAPRYLEKAVFSH